MPEFLTTFFKISAVAKRLAARSDSAAKLGEYRGALKVWLVRRAIQRGTHRGFVFLVVSARGAFVLLMLGEVFGHKFDSAILLAKKMPSVVVELLRTNGRISCLSLLRRGQA